MSWKWLGVVASRPPDAIAAATLHRVGGAALGMLAAWEPDAAAVDHAVKVDARAVDPAGEPALVSLVMAPPGIYLPFDDPAVSSALRKVLQGRGADVVSTLLLGDDRFAGALTAVRGADTSRLDDDPFASCFPARIVVVGRGLLGRMPAAVGPGIQRHGADNPWPWDRFAAVGPAGSLAARRMGN